ncbi:hypothetical protein JD292_02515 [Leucobacter sp. CSA2]|uniref:PQQ-binding-like beta-propeller repeat protein n=1 Tax=Leucobacter edaphi TaxID=2796472 RepID=A0A934QBS8_9MICO|nr:hypothetical protein [Leucobacter edaphi]MBK0420955.1 hypothetical protein [Leucobacter edaphi]
MNTQVRRRSAAALTALGIGAALLLAGCSKYPDPNGLTFHPEGTKSGWMLEDYKNGPGETIQIKEGEDVCGFSKDHTVLVRMLPRPTSKAGYARSGIVGIDTATGKELWNLPSRACNPTDMIDGVLYMSPNQWYGESPISDMDDRNYWRADPKTGKQIGQPYMVADRAQFFQVLGEHDGSVYASVNNGLVVKATDGKIDWQTDPPQESTDCVLIPNGKYVGCATTGDLGTYKVVDTSTGKLTVPETPKSGEVASIEWFSDGFSLGPQSYKDGEATYFDYTGKKLESHGTVILPGAPAGVFYSMADAKERNTVNAVNAKGKPVAAFDDNGVKFFPSGAVYESYSTPDVQSSASGNTVLVVDDNEAKFFDAKGKQYGSAPAPGQSLEIIDGVIRSYDSATGAGVLVMPKK